MLKFTIKLLKCSFLISTILYSYICYGGLPRCKSHGLIIKAALQLEKKTKKVELFSLWSEVVGTYKEFYLSVDKKKSDLIPLQLEVLFVSDGSKKAIKRKKFKLAVLGDDSNERQEYLVEEFEFLKYLLPQKNWPGKMIMKVLGKKNAICKQELLILRLEQV
ncbi:MAG: hypothetical protein ISR65_13455 [Bacteriovoracaceae bacterium]|nr:hypothetical protein [Bacteriovoracaceae bacterium]